MDPPIVFIKSRLKKKDIKLKTYSDDCAGWFYHSNYSESSPEGTWWNTSPKLLDSFLPFIFESSYEFDDPVERNHREMVRTAFAHRCYNVIVCHTFVNI